MPVKRLRIRPIRDVSRRLARCLLELFGLIQQGQARMHGLHAENLVVTLLIVEHRRGEILECILGCERSMCLRERV